MKFNVQKFKNLILFLIPILALFLVAKNSSFGVQLLTSISEDPNKAKEAGQKPSYFSKNLKMDSNFDKNASKYLMEGLEAKFTQNEDLKKILLDTKNAKITHYHRANEPVVLKEMMELRTKLK